MNAINVAYVNDVIHYVYCIKCNFTIYDFRLYINYIILYYYVTIDYDYYYFTTITTVIIISISLLFLELLLQLLL